MVNRGLKRYAKTFILAFVSVALSLGLLLFTQKSFLKASYPCKYRDFVEEFSESYGVDKWLIYSVIRTESGFDISAKSNAEAKGLMQITEETYSWAQQRKNLPFALSHDTLYNPKTSIDFGSYILSLLLEEFENEETAISAYHAGWGNVKSWLKDEKLSPDGKHLITTPFKSTNHYVKKVMETKAIYQALWG